MSGWSIELSLNPEIKVRLTKCGSNAENGEKRTKTGCSNNSHWFGTGVTLVLIGTPSLTFESQQA
jgi:hypothetical protein